MLINLHVKNLALIEELDLEFFEGLNILTGETGAGKSIIINSIQSVLGNKFSKDNIRNGCEYAFIEALFNINQLDTIELLKNFDIPIEDNGELLITRKINKQGRSIFKVNTKTVTASIVKEIAENIMDIYSQHDHQSLLNKRKHLEILDAFCDDQLIKDKEDLQKILKNYQSLKKELDNQKMDEDKRQREIAFLEFEINEIESARLEIGEDDTLQNEYKTMVHSKEIVEVLSNIYELTSGMRAESAIEIIGKTSKLCQQIQTYDKNLNIINKQLNTIESMLSDVNRDISRYIDNITFNEEKFINIEERLNQINSLKVKYGSSIENIFEYLEKNKIKYNQLQEYEAYRNEIIIKIKQIKEQLNKICKKITTKRQNKAKEIEKQIKKALIDLNFLDVKFEISIKKLENYTINGIDDVEFLISTNPGESLKPLNKVASGGELSRIMLAIKSVLAKKDKTPTLIFDEIDVGISGRTAQKVSEKLAVIANNHQIICITHLPQIASMSDHHYLIRKTTDHIQTTVSVNQLKKDQKINEIARLISGVKITETVLHSAKEMLQMANNLKEKMIQ